MPGKGPGRRSIKMWVARAQNMVDGAAVNFYCFNISKTFHDHIDKIVFGYLKPMVDCESIKNTYNQESGHNFSDGKQL